MKTSIRNILSLLMICCFLCGPVQAEHDSGQGKSQDGGGDGELASVAVAPEPSTLLIFLLGSLGLAAAYRQKSTKYVPEDR
jgi:hypothetical protein